MHRCARHIRVRNHNLNADAGSEECGGCIMEEVFFLAASRLDLLDVIANLLTAQTRLRRRLSDNERRLAFYEPQAPAKES